MSPKDTPVTEGNISLVVSWLVDLVARKGVLVFISYIPLCVSLVWSLISIRLHASTVTQSIIVISDTEESVAHTHAVPLSYVNHTIFSVVAAATVFTFCVSPKRADTGIFSCLFVLGLNIRKREVSGTTQEFTDALFIFILVGDKYLHARVPVFVCACVACKITSPCTN